MNLEIQFTTYYTTVEKNEDTSHARISRPVVSGQLAWRKVRECSKGVAPAGIYIPALGARR